MKEFFASLFFSQPPSPSSREGLPFWIFWFLLFIILLLVIFIFLRDKDLRQRLNDFMFKTKKKIKKLRLQARLNRERREKAELLRDMGKKIWQDSIFPEKEEKMRDELNKLEERRSTLAKEMENTSARIGTLKH